MNPFDDASAGGSSKEREKECIKTFLTLMGQQHMNHWADNALLA
jgi:hypothetical protein